MKKLVLALSATTLAVAVAGGMLWTQLNRERDRLAELRAGVTELENVQATAMASALAPAAALAAPDGAPGATAPDVASPATNAGNRMQDLSLGLTQALSSPEASEMIQSQLRAALTQQFPDLASELQLSPAEAERLMNLLAKQAAGMTGDALGMFTAGGGEAAQQSQRRMIEKQLASEKEIASALGNKYPAWQEYQGTAAARQEVSQLRSLLGTGPDALTEAQSAPLIAAIGAERTRFNKEEQNRMSTVLRSSQSINVLEDQLKTMSAQNERLASAASPHLSSSQLDRYKRILTQQESLLRAIAGSMNGSGSAAGQAGVQR